MASIVGKILEEGIDWVARGVEAGLEKDVVENIVKNGKASAQRQLKAAIIKGEQKTAVKSTERFVQKGVEKNTIKQADKQVLDLALESEKASKETVTNTLNNVEKQKQFLANDRSANYVEESTESVTDDLTNNIVKDYQQQRTANLHNNYRSPQDIYADADGTLKSTVIANDIIAEDKTYGKAMSDLRRAKSDQRFVTSTTPELTVNFDVPKNEGFTVNSSFAPTSASTEPTFNFLGTKTVAFDKPVEPVLASNGRIDPMKLDLNPGESNKTIGAFINNDRGTSNLTKALKESTKIPEPSINENSAWGSTAKAVLGTAVGGAALCAALSSSRGQQSNAQLYGQQPLY